MQRFLILGLAISAGIAILDRFSVRADDSIPYNGDFLTVFDYQKYADSIWDRATRQYFECGALLQQTRDDNRDAYTRIRFLPRYMRDVSHLDMKTTVLGHPVSFPVGIAPSDFHRLANDIGENGTAKAAEDAGTLMTLSTFSTISLEQVAKSAPGCIRWFQLYAFKDRSLTRDLVKRAEKAGYSAIVVTADTPVTGTKLANIRNRFNLPPYLTLANLQGFKAFLNRNLSGDSQSEYFISLIDPSLTWKDIALFKTYTKLPIVVKGILTPQDAELAIQHGANAIWVSNHGGRQLDGAPATIDALPNIIKAVKNRTEVYVDGGIRTGMDVVKALAMGARMVFIGRPNLYGLSHGGTSGARAVLEILRSELNNTMALIGAPSLKDITPDMVYRDNSSPEIISI